MGAGFANVTDGDGAAWNLWAHTCDQPRCDCREALVLATREGADLLAPFIRRVEAASVRKDVAARLVGGAVVGFEVEIDTGEISALDDGDLTTDTAAAGGAIDGVVLDQLHAQWLAGKGTIKAAGEPGPAPQGWRSGDLVGWLQMFPWARCDRYVVDEALIDVDELFCVAPGCTCQDVRISAFDLDAEVELGAVCVKLDGAEIVVDAAVQSHWERYTARHKHWRARLAARRSQIRGLDVWTVRPVTPPVVRGVKVGRNDDCPCGSGNKYKRCCLDKGLAPT